MRTAILLTVLALPLGACDLVQQAAENQIRAEVSDRAQEAGNELRNSPDLDERYVNVANVVLDGEAGVRARAEGEVNQRMGDAVNQATGR